MTKDERQVLWGLRVKLGGNLLAKLLGLTVCELANYETRKATTEIRARISFLGLILFRLRMGRRNDIQQWFNRRRLLLNNKSPSGYLLWAWGKRNVGSWEVKLNRSQKVLELAGETTNRF